MDTEPRYVAFAGARLLIDGPASEALPILKRRFEKGQFEDVLVFDAATGRQIEIDLSPPLPDLLERAAGEAPRGPGRPKLGVTSREVSLLPRHWDWLEAQQQGISAAIRRLVEQEMKRNPGRERARRIRASLNHILTALAGNRPNYEEATRALFADDVAALEGLVERWPRDLRDYAVQRARAARAAEHGGPPHDAEAD